jgi:tryptophan synthase alpha subunit
VLHYYAAVNALTGLVYLVWVTGTTGVDHGSTTMVRRMLRLHPP